MDVIVYHGSNVLVKEPDVEHSKGLNLDFGTGFYVTNDFTAACEYAEDRAINLGGRPVVTSYILNIDLLEQWGCVFLGDTPTMEWFNVVKNFRQYNEPLPQYKHCHGYVGLIADFRAQEVFESYFNGNITAEEALIMLFKVVLQPQICLKSNAVIKDVLMYTYNEHVEQGFW